MIFTVDGIKISKRGNIIGKKGKKNKNAKIIKLIKAYLKKLKSLGTLPKPNGGDCWICLMADSNKDNDHLMSHLKEKYIHGTLIYNAMKAAGYNDQGIGIYWNWFNSDNTKTSILNAVSKYFKVVFSIPR